MVERAPVRIATRMASRHRYPEAVVSRPTASHRPDPDQLKKVVVGFSKTGEQNWTILNALDAFGELGYPVLVAASRKRFLGELLASPDGTLAATDDRDAATAAVTTLAAAAGAWCVRVHDVRPSADAVRVVARWSRG